MPSAATFSATSAMGTSTSWPSPVRRRCASAEQMANAAW